VSSQRRKKLNNHSAHSIGHRVDSWLKKRDLLEGRNTLADLWKLIGIAIVIVGLALRLRTTLVVVTAALVTGLVAGLPLFSSEGFFQQFSYLARPGQEGIINMLGRAFADNRLMTLFIITLPAIGLAERYGLQEQSAAVIRRIAAATVGRLQIVYQLFRVLTGILGIRLNGHPSFVRPLIFPMSIGAAEATFGAASGKKYKKRSSKISKRQMRRARTTAISTDRISRPCNPESFSCLES